MCSNKIHPLLTSSNLSFTSLSKVRIGNRPDNPPLTSVTLCLTCVTLDMFATTTDTSEGIYGNPFPEENFIDVKCVFE